MKNKLLYLFVCLFATLWSCDKTPHEMEDLPDGSESGVTVALNTDDVQGKPLNDVHLYFFDEADRLAAHAYYPTMPDLALDRLLLESGHYTVFAILNTEEGLTPPSNAAQRAASYATRAEALPDISFPDFILWVKTLDAQYENLLTGMLRYEVKEGIARITIDIKEGSGAAETTTVTLHLTYPQPLLPDYVAVKALRAGESVRLRAVVELFHKGTDNKILRSARFVEPTATAGVYSTAIVMPQGEFDVRIWGDYAGSETEDYHYNTANLKDVRILPKEAYWANTDTRDGFGYAASITVGQEEKTESYTLHRPLAKYKIIATDVEEYNGMRERRGYPPVDELKISVVYAGFFPAGYSVVDRTLTASGEGYGYAAGVTEGDDRKATVAKDFVLVNGRESGVVVNIIFKDAEGNTVSGVNGVKINYKAGYLTTVSGDFLTAGKGGIDIDTSWDDEFNIEF